VETKLHIDRVIIIIIIIIINTVEMELHIDRELIISINTVEMELHIDLK
jgi:hypothetical protein